MMKFKGLELDFDIYDADQAEAFETALNRVREECARKPPDETLSGSIRRQCEAVFDFFDDLFGDGFHQEVFGTKTNLIECLSAFGEFTDLVNERKRDLESLTTQYASGRTPRRAAPAAGRK